VAKASAPDHHKYDKQIAMPGAGQKQLDMSVADCYKTHAGE